MFYTTKCQSKINYKTCNTKWLHKKLGLIANTRNQNAVPEYQSISAGNKTASKHGLVLGLRQTMCNRQ